ncbi:large ribosomal subunit protein uL13m-like [Symsagittifera roscoffensis]|uniref:large ribosomal subunit protein uL13m-like n=1 Tax=Symsagittifera roscoffensis TaxID=84072 RepID=UPI00307BC6CD
MPTPGSGLSRGSALAASFARNWYLIDASWHHPVHLAQKCSTILQGRHKPLFAWKQDCGDHVVVMNCSQLAMSEFEWEFHRFTDQKTTRPGDKVITFAWEFLRDNPGQIVRRTTRLYLETKRIDFRDAWLTRLHCFKDKNIPDNILRNVNFMLPRKKVPRKLSEYSQEQIDNFPVIWAKSDQYKF